MLEDHFIEYQSILQAREYIGDKSSVDSNGSLDFYDGPVSRSTTGGYENEGFQPSTAASLVKLAYFITHYMNFQHLLFC